MSRPSRPLTHSSHRTVINRPSVDALDQRHQSVPHNFNFTNNGTVIKIYIDPLRPVEHSLSPGLRHIIHPHSIALSSSINVHRRRTNASKAMHARRQEDPRTPHTTRKLCTGQDEGLSRCHRRWHIIARSGTFAIRVSVGRPSFSPEGIPFINLPVSRKISTVQRTSHRRRSRRGGTRQTPPSHRSPHHLSRHQGRFRPLWKIRRSRHELQRRKGHHDTRR